MTKEAEKYLRFVPKGEPKTIFILENKRDNELYYNLTQEQVEEKVKELGLKGNEWFAHLGC